MQTCLWNGLQIEQRLKLNKNHSRPNRERNYWCSFLSSLLFADWTSHTQLDKIFAEETSFHFLISCFLLFCFIAVSIALSNIFKWIALVLVNPINHAVAALELFVRTSLRNGDEKWVHGLLFPLSFCAFPWFLSSQLSLHLVWASLCKCRPPRFFSCLSDSLFLFLGSLYSSCFLFSPILSLTFASLFFSIFRFFLLLVAVQGAAEIISVAEMEGLLVSQLPSLPAVFFVSLFPFLFSKLSLSVMLPACIVSSSPSNIVAFLWRWLPILRCWFFVHFKLFSWICMSLLMFEHPVRIGITC